MTHRITAIDVYETTGQQEYEDLRNDPTVRIIAQQDFFALAVSHGEGGSSTPIITRVVDYVETEPEAASYIAPLC